MGRSAGKPTGRRSVAGILALGLALAGLCASTDAPSQGATPSSTEGEAVAGQNYVVLEPARSAANRRVPVYEVFWFGCPHCYHLEPAFAAWAREGRPAYVDVVRVPVIWNEITRQHARLFYVLDALVQEAALHEAVFREIHENRQPLADPDPARAAALQTDFLVAQGLARPVVEAALRSPRVAAALQDAETLTRRFNAVNVPTFVVNGRLATDVGQAGGEAALFRLLNRLAEGERHP